MPRHPRWPLVLLAAAGCQPTPPPAPVPPRGLPVTTRSAGPRTFDSPALGIAFTYPADWSSQPGSADPDAPALRVVAPPAVGTAVLTLTVPKLPFHIPGMIPVALVASGYADDVRKRMPDATGPAARPVTVPDAAARRVTLAGHRSDGRAWVEDAVLVVHGDRVYVLAADSDPPGRPAAAAALDAAVASLRWVR